MAIQEYKPQQMSVRSINGRQSSGKSPLWAVHLGCRLALNLSESRLTLEAALPNRQLGLRGGRQVTQVPQT